MNILKVYDGENYSPDMPVFEKYSVRAIIMKDGKLATQKGAAGDYKILGGGVDEGESFSEALIREVREEAGLLVVEDSIREIGEIMEKREDLFEKGTVFLCHSCYFTCQVKDEMVETQMTASEIAKGYHLCWATPEEIIAGNEAFLNQPWTRRDTEFIRDYLCK